jgi:VanZ family protein
MQKLFPWLSRWWPALLMMILIFIASSIPGDRMPNAGNWDFSVKKGGHMTGYALLAVGLIRGQSRREKINFVLALAGCGLYALSDEFHQSFVPGRNAALMDVGIDLIGASIGLIISSISIRGRCFFSSTARKKTPPTWLSSCL